MKGFTVVLHLLVFLPGLFQELYKDSVVKTFMIFLSRFWPLQPQL